MIEITNLSYKYKNGKTVLEDINLTIQEGEIISIIRKEWLWKINTCKANRRDNISNLWQSFNRWNRHQR